MLASMNMALQDSAHLQRDEVLLVPLDEVVLHLHQLPARQLQPHRSAVSMPSSTRCGADRGAVQHAMHIGTVFTEPALRWLRTAGNEQRGYCRCCRVVGRRVAGCPPCRT